MILQTATVTKEMAEMILLLNRAYEVMKLLHCIQFFLFLD